MAPAFNTKNVAPWRRLRFLFTRRLHCYLCVCVCARYVRVACLGICTHFLIEGDTGRSPDMAAEGCWGVSFPQVAETGWGRTASIALRLHLPEVIIGYFMTNFFNSNSFVLVSEAD